MSDYPLSSPNEPLSWGQRQIGFDDGETDDAGLEIDPAFSFPWPDDPDERTIVPIKMSLHEYTALLSAVDVGAAIAWTNDALKVYYILVRSLQVPPMADCDEISECIENDENVQDAIFDLLDADLDLDTESRLGNDIQNYLLDNEDYLASLGIALTPYLNQTEGLEPGGLDDDEFWAMCVGVARYTNTVIVDFLEVMELHTDKQEFVTKFLDSVPVLGSLLNAVGATQWAEDFDWIQEVLVEQYVAGWTETEGGTMYKFACLLYCNCPDKSITFSRIIETSEQLASQYIPINLQNAFTLMSSLVGLSGSGAPIVWGAFTFTWGLARFMSLVGLQRISNNTLKIVLKGASQQSEGTFSDHCDSCEELSCFEFTISPQDWTDYGETGAQWVPDVGFGQNLNGPMTLLAPLGNDIEVTSLQVVFSRSWAGANDYDKFFAVIANADGSNAQTFNGGSLLFGGRTFVFESTSGVWVRPRAQFTAGGYGFPPNVNNTTPQYVERICFNPE